MLVGSESCHCVEVEVVVTLVVKKVCHPMYWPSLFLFNAI